MGIDKVKATRIASVVAGISSALGWGYLGFADIWGWEYGSQVWASSNVITGTISIALAAITARKGFREDGSYGDVTDGSLRDPEGEVPGIPATGATAGSAVVDGSALQASQPSSSTF